MPHTKYHNIKLMPSDNGGYHLTYHTKVDRPTMSESHHKDHNETYSASEEKTALGRVLKLHKMNMDNHKKMMGKKSEHKSKHQSHNPQTSGAAGSY